MKTAISLLEDDSHRLIWISGRAGTGKSTFLQFLKEEIKPRNTVYLAPTAIAALTIGGQTIHSFFWLDPKGKAYFETKLDSDKEQQLFSRLAIVETIVLDEISMVRADILDEIDRRMRKAKRKTELPFGGTRLVLIGDAYQLPPVLPDPFTSVEELFEKRYKSPFFFSSQVLRTRARKISLIEFTRVFRQNEVDFLAVLDRCRSGEMTESDIDLLQSRVLPEGKKPPSDHLVLTAKKNDAHRLNQYRMNDLSGQTRSYTAMSTGKFADTLNDEDLPAPRVLELKVGARVMFTVNSPEGRWINGALATVIRLEDDRVILQNETGEFAVEPYEWKKSHFTVRSGQLVEETADEYRQYPFMLGWAITIHRAQGRTLEKRFCRPLSRCFCGGASLCSHISRYAT